MCPKTDDARQSLALHMCATHEQHIFGVLHEIKPCYIMISVRVLFYLLMYYRDTISKERLFSFCSQTPVNRIYHLVIPKQTNEIFYFNSFEIRALDYVNMLHLCKLLS